MNKKIFVFSMLLIGLSACSKKEEDKAVQDNGNCTQAMVDSYNDVNNKVSAYRTFPTQEGLAKVKNSCLYLQSLIGDRSCKAENVMNGNTMDISYLRVKPVCDLALGVDKPNGESPVQAAQPYAKGFSLVIVDETILSILFSSAGELVIQEGTVSDTASISKQKNYCWVSKNYGAQVVYGMNLSFSLKDQNSTDLIFVNAEGTAELQCRKPSSTVSWSKEDIQNVFSHTARILIKE